MTTPSPQALQAKHSHSEEIDLKQIAAALSRRSRLIIGITAVAFALSCLNAFTRKTIWQGDFQIVLETNDSSSPLGTLSSNSMLSGLAGIGGSSSTLETEVEILQSNSVMKSVYDFARSSKEKKGINTQSWRYNNWKNSSLDVELIPRTTILSIEYRDSDRDFILPVLNRIKETYQEYSGKDRRRGLIKGVAYLEKEIKKLRQQSDSSMRKAQAYALANGLGIQDGMPTSAGGNGSSGGSVEASRESVQNNVNSLKQQIKAAQEAGAARVYQAPQLAANNSLYSKLQNLETNLQNKSALLTPQDQSIIRLQRERRGLISYINQQTIGLLQGELMTAEAELKSVTRPRNVILKHRELVRTAIRDEKTLSELELQLQSLKLEQARQSEPWELISTPTVLDRPVAPQKKQIVALGVLGGLLVSCSFALLLERRTGLVFSEDELKFLLPFPMLERLYTSATEQWSATTQLLAQGPLSKAQSVALIPVGNLSKRYLDELERALRQALGHRELIVTRDLLKSRSCDNQLLVTALGASQRQELRQLREQLSLQGGPVAGWLMMDSLLNMEE